MGDCLKNFFEDLFFFLENTCGYVLGPWPRAFLSLASRRSVLGNAVLGLGLGFFLCPRPWPRALCPRLHLSHEHLHRIQFKVFYSNLEASVQCFSNCGSLCTARRKTFTDTVAAQLRGQRGLPPIVKSLKKFSPNMPTFKRVLELICK